MANNPSEKDRFGEPVRLIEEDGTLTRVGEWASYMAKLGTTYAVRRETPTEINADDPFNLAIVPTNQLDEYLAKESPDFSINPTTYWQTRLQVIQEEIDKVGPNNSKLGISLLTLKGFMEERLSQLRPNQSPMPQEQQTGIEKMFGNGLRVKELHKDTVKLTPVNPKDRDLLRIRSEALGRLSQCYEYSEMIRVPTVRSISPTGDYVEVDRAPGFSLININREQQIAIAELPMKLRLRIVKQLLRGIDILNLQGYIFGDYNEMSFHFDPDNNQLWIIDPGASEKKEYADPRPYDEVAREEIFKMLDGNGFFSILEIFGVAPTTAQEIKRKNTQKKLLNVGQIVDLL